MPNFTIVLNSSFAMVSFSGFRRRAFDLIGGPLVMMKCLTECFGFLGANFGVINAGLFLSIVVNSSCTLIAVILTECVGMSEP